MKKEAKEVLTMVLEAWKEGRQETMYELTSETFKEEYSYHEFIDNLPCLRLKDYLFTGKSIVFKDLPYVDFELVITDHDKVITVPSRVICEKGAYMPSEFGTWGWYPNVQLKRAYGFRTGKTLGKAEVSKHIKKKQGYPGHIR